MLHWYEINVLKADAGTSSDCTTHTAANDVNERAKKARHDVPSMNQGMPQVGMDPWRSSYPPLLNPSVQSGSYREGCPGHYPGGFFNLSKDRGSAASLSVCPSAQSPWKQSLSSEVWILLRNYFTSKKWNIFKNSANTFEKTKQTPSYLQLLN